MFLTLLYAYLFMALIPFALLMWLPSHLNTGFSNWPRVEGGTEPSFAVLCSSGAYLFRSGCVAR